jgi:hypothetical protein
VEDVAEVADRGASVERYAGVLDSVRFMVFPFGGDCGGSMFTAGGAVGGGAGRGRKFREGDGDMFAGSFVRRARSPATSPISLSLPLATLRPSPASGAVSCFPENTLVVSPLTDAKLFPLGLGERALGGGVFFGLALAICSKCERREDTGFCNEELVQSRGNRHQNLDSYN